MAGIYHSGQGKKKSICLFLTLTLVTPCCPSCQVQALCLEFSSLPHWTLPAAPHVGQRWGSAGGRSKAQVPEMVLKKAESTKEQRRGRERKGWGGTELTNRTSCFLLHTSLSSDQSGSLPSSSSAHQPGAERQLSDSLGHRPAGCALGQHVFSGPDCKPSTDVPKGTDGEYPAWAMAQVG